MICPQVPKQLRNRQKSMKSDKMTIKRLAGVRYAPGFTLYLEPTFSRVPFHYSRVVNRANAVLTWLLTTLTKCLLWVNSWAILAKLAIRHIFIDKVEVCVTKTTPPLNMKSSGISSVIIHKNVWKKAILKYMQDLFSYKDYF